MYIIYIFSATGADTFCTQAYGAGKFKEVGIWAVVAASVQFALFIPILLIWMFGSSFIFETLLRQDQTVSKAATLFVRVVGPAMLPYVMQEILRKWLQAQVNRLHK